MSPKSRSKEDERRSKEKDSTPSSYHHRSSRHSNDRKRDRKRSRSLKRSRQHTSSPSRRSPSRSRSPLRSSSTRKYRDEENGHRRRHDSKSRSSRHRYGYRATSPRSTTKDYRRRDRHERTRKSRRRSRERPSSSESTESSSSSSASPSPVKNNNNKSNNGPIAVPPPAPPTLVSSTMSYGISNMTTLIKPPVVPLPNFVVNASYVHSATAFQLLPPPPPPPPPGDSIVDLPPPPPPSTPPPPEPPRQHSNQCMNAMSNLLNSKNSQAHFTKHDVMKKLMEQKAVVYKKENIADLPPNWGRMTLSDYDIEVQVGEGTYGQVYKARKGRNGRLVALKKVRLENEKDGFPITAVREIKLLRKLNHENIVKLLDIITESPPENKKDINAFYLVFEYVDHDLNGLLESQLVTFTEQTCASLFKQLLLALQHCHSSNLLHRDLKCANILVNNKGELKLGDFGLARIYTTKSRLYTNRVITLWYRPPELLLGAESYGPSIDIWSAGCILGELFVKKPIFQGQSEAAQMDLIMQTCGCPTPTVWPDVVNLKHYPAFKAKTYFNRTLKNRFAFLPSGALDLFDKCLTLDPSKRPSAEEALFHPWLIDIDPRTCKMQLPQDQDCHEMWSKRNRQEQKDKTRRSQNPPQVYR
ncbi:unnamed protein product [Bursaphelenchus okinawaensis]|uniref:Protein kinase domain-containing protein n=1 Tax=Bursaphelenchus okinawaensis TaxID=465554 RepID=A0A811L9S2_9BILA|nr:unnamed protein product [Bursaphelenchus okinawaensis]CAG9119828.1 unnamed protein product [Bursaphelenchus okinawaensis]